MRCVSTEAGEAPIAPKGAAEGSDGLGGRSAWPGSLELAGSEPAEVLGDPAILAALVGKCETLRLEGRLHLAGLAVDDA